MVTVSWNRKGVLMVEFTQKRTKITLEVYCEIYKKLHRAGNSEQRRGMLTSFLVFLYDNALPHKVARTQALLEHFNWELFDHPSYSLDRALSDNHLFTYLKNWLISQVFSNNEELMKGVKT
jgi:glycine cleavage system protein P-like pyridoxal-binding family